MALDYYSRIYVRQEYLTPGAPETVACVAGTMHGGEAPLVLEVASGKGEAACTLAQNAGCRVIGLDRHPPFLRHARDKSVRRGLAGTVQFVRGDGKLLPFPDATFTAGYCMGAPSLVGLEPCLRELRRVVRPGGYVVVSDIHWHHKPEQPLGPEWDWMATEQQRLSLDEYRAVIEECELQVEEVRLHDVEAWEAYHEPMRETAAAERARGEASFAGEIERLIEMERRGVDLFLGYATFIARNR